MSPRLLAIAVSLVAPTPASSSGHILFAGGGWAAIDRGFACEALSRAVRIAAHGKVQAIAGFAFTPDRKRWGEFHARLSRTPRPGSSAMLNVGGQPFLLALRGSDAWSRGPLQEQAIIAAARQAPAMRIEARDAGGRRFADTYSLDGTPTAIDSAAGRCALRGAGKI